MSWNFLVILKSAVANPLVSSVETFNELRETKQVAKKKEPLSKKVVVSSSVSSYCFSGLLFLLLLLPWLQFWSQHWLLRVNINHFSTPTKSPLSHKMRTKIECLPKSQNLEQIVYKLFTFYVCLSMMISLCFKVLVSNFTKKAFEGTKKKLCHTFFPPSFLPFFARASHGLSANL